MQGKKPQRKKAEKPSAARTILIERIGMKGHVTLAEYMEIAVAHYYAARDPFGEEGDFITAPEVSQMFGELLGAWTVDAWMQAGRPQKAHIIELGPGRGTLAADVMRTVSTWPDSMAALDLHLVEASPLMRRMQAEELKAYAPTWHETLATVPEGPCFILANEFFDALPVHQYEKKGGKWFERCVGYDADDDRFFITLAETDAENLPEAPEGGIYETSPASLAVLNDICRRLGAQGGAALIVDYGHAAPGFGDTVQAVKDHLYAPVLENPGRHDITAHVDFSAFKKSAARFVSVHGPAEQGAFLSALGINLRAAALRETATGEQRAAIDAALDRLLSPRQMGKLFKVLGLTPIGSTIQPAGFDKE